MASPPPALMEELVEEILLRFPPHEPSRLVHAALVCKRWRRLISAPGFRRMYREFHRAPPMLGFICNWSVPAAGILDGAQLVPTAPVRAPLPSLPRRCRALDARHGRVLLRFPGDPHMAGVNGLVVWDPVTGEQRELPSFTPRPWLSGGQNWTAAVLCAAATCDHRDCHRGSFLVVCVASSYQEEALILTYSSDDDTWSETISTPHRSHRNDINPRKPCLFVSNALYFGFAYKLLKYDLQLQQISWIRLPSASASYNANCTLTTTESGGLGLATIHDCNKLSMCMWSWNDARDGVDAGWMQSRVIELETLLPAADAILTSPNVYVVGFAESVGLIFLTVDNVLFTIDLRTYKAKKVFKGRRVYTVFPCMSFYTPALEAAYKDDEAICTDDEASM